MQKTIVVEIEIRKAHPKYKRVMKSNKKFYAHDELNSARVGDVVRIREARPLSKLKRWSLEEIVRRSSLAQLDEKDAGRGSEVVCGSRGGLAARQMRASRGIGPGLSDPGERICQYR